MAARVAHLVLADGARQHEGAPVGNVAYDAALAEDELAGCENDSADRVEVSVSYFSICQAGLGMFEKGSGRSSGWDRGGTHSRTSARLLGRTC